MNIKVIIAILVLALATIAAGQSQNFEVTGETRIEKGDTLLARQNAIYNAMDMALNQAVENILPSKIISENRSKISDEVMGKRLGYISKVIVLDETIKNSSLNLIKIKASVAVNTEAVNNRLNQLGLMAFKENLPKVLVIIQEKNIDYVHWHFQDNTLNNSELTIWKILDHKGFSKDIQASVIQNITSDIEQNFYTDDLNAIAKLAAGYGPDIVIVGKAISRPVITLGESSDSASAVAMVTLRAIRAMDGLELASSSASITAASVGESETGALAIELASEDAIIKITPQIMEEWAEGLEPVVELTMFVSGLKSLEDLIEFKNEFLNNIEGIKSFERRTFSGGAAAYDVVSTIGADAIAMQLKTTGLKSFETKVRSHSETSIDISVKLR